MKIAPLKSMLAAAVGLILSTAADAAKLNNAAYLYSGPGYNYATLVSLPRGANVGLGHCQGPWCSASYGGQSGWLHQSFLVRTGTFAGGNAPCRGGPSRCKKSLLNSFALGVARRAAASGNRGGANFGNNQPSLGNTFLGNSGPNR